MGSFSIWHWLVVLIITSPLLALGIYGIYRRAKRRRFTGPEKAGSSSGGRNKIFCPQCGNANDISAKYCSNCGSSLPQVAHDAPALNTADTAADESAEFYRAIVGPKHQDYYLRHFQRFDARGKTGVSWHWPALFVTFYWFLYRKMWLSALIYFFLPYLVMIPLAIAAAIAGKSADVVVGVGYILYLIGIFLLPALYANALYYNHCKEKIADIKASPYSYDRRLGELSGKGGTSVVPIVIFLPIVFFAVIGILAAIAVPAYQDYTIRARMTEAVTDGTKAAQLVSAYYEQYQRVPNSLEEAGFSVQFSPFIKTIDVDNTNGIITVTIASAPLTDKTLLFIPSLDANNHIVWKCTSQNIEVKYLPYQCRQQK